MRTIDKQTIFLALGLSLIGVFGRLLPHLWNFAPIVAIGLFAGTYLGTRSAILVPMMAMVLGDIFLGFYDWHVMVAVYGSFVTIALCGRFLIDRVNPTTVLMASIGGSVFFYLSTNAAVWAYGTMYPHTGSGLIASYVAGIPFFRNALMGDVIYTSTLFGAYALFTSYLSARSTSSDRIANPIA